MTELICLELLAGFRFPGNGYNPLFISLFLSYVIAEYLVDFSGFPAFRIWMHSPPRHTTYSVFRQGINTRSDIVPSFKLTSEFFSQHQFVSMISDFDLIKKNGILWTG